MKTLLVTLALLATIGCSHPPVKQPAQPASACQSDYTRDQFIGTWTEAVPTKPVAILNDDGTLGGSTKGTWEFTKWSNTPETAPEGQADRCVLWIKDEPLNLVYNPVAVTGDTLTLVYIPRTNTHVWHRQNNA